MGIYGFYGERVFIFLETIHLYLLPVLLSFFILIQGAKRTHDINKSGWYFLIPLYNIYLSFLPGTKGNNDYGIDPKPIKNVHYFDELENNVLSSLDQQSASKNKRILEIILQAIFSILVLFLLIWIFNYKPVNVPEDLPIIDSLNVPPTSIDSKVKNHRKHIGLDDASLLNSKSEVKHQHSLNLDSSTNTNPSCRQISPSLIPNVSKSLNTKSNSGYENYTTDEVEGEDTTTTDSRTLLR
jgi:hypothetical protein